MIEQQRLRRCEQKKKLDAYRSGVEMTAKEKERGRKLDLARKKKMRSSAITITRQHQGRTIKRGNQIICL
jgi:hypothetical protein